MGAATTGLKPIAEISVFGLHRGLFRLSRQSIFEELHDQRAGEVPAGVVRTANGGGARFGAQHSQSVENWCMMIPGLKVVAPSTPLDVIALLRRPCAIRIRHLSAQVSMPLKAKCPMARLLGVAKIVRPGTDATIRAGAIRRARLQPRRNSRNTASIGEVIDVRSSSRWICRRCSAQWRTRIACSRWEENPRLADGARSVSIIADEALRP